jgi:uncharacterized membrane protein YfcA
MKDTRDLALARKESERMDASVAVMILFAGLFSGFVDALAGGGGLIMIPALMLGGLPVHAAVATNKLCGTTGSLASSLMFVRAKRVDWRACAAMGFPAVLGALAGSQLVSALSRDWAEPIVIALVIAVTLWVLLKPKLTRTPSTGTPAPMTAGRMIQSGALGALFGFHDGFFGPGAGTFIVFALLGLWSLNFVQGTGSAKVIGLMTNVTAVLSFFWVGAVDLPKGLLASAGVVVGAYAGAALAATTAARLIKPLFVIATALIVGKLLVGYLLR